MNRKSWILCDISLPRRFAIAPVFVVVCLLSILLVNCGSAGLGIAPEEPTPEEPTPEEPTPAQSASLLTPNEELPDIIGDPFTPVMSTAVEFLLDFSFSASSKSTQDANYSCVSNLEDIRKQVPLFFFSVAYERPELDIDIGVSYFNGNFKSDPDGYYPLIPLGKSFRNDTGWYRIIKDLSDTNYGENYAKSINRSLINLKNSQKEKQFAVFIGDGTYGSIEKIEEIQKTMNLSDNRQLRIILFCTNKHQRKDWEYVFRNEDNRVRIDFIDLETNSYAWLYRLSQEILGVRIPKEEQATTPKNWLNAGTVPHEETDTQSPESDSLGQVSVDRSESIGPIAGDAKWRLHAVQFGEGGQIRVNNREYVIEAFKELPNIFFMDIFHPIQPDCEPKSVDVYYTGPGPVLYWIEQRRPTFSTPTLEMSHFSVTSPIVTAVIKIKVEGTENLSNLQMCYQPFLKIDDNEVKSLPISSFCNSIICVERSFLTSRYLLETSFSKNAAVHFGFTRNYNGEIVSESEIQPAPFIVQTQDSIKGRLGNEKEQLKNSIGNSVETYIFDIPVFFYDPLRWDVSIKAESIFDNSRLSGRKVEGIDSTCPGKETIMNTEDSRMKYEISSENDYIRLFFASNVAWDFMTPTPSQGTSTQVQYCGFESIRIIWEEKNSHETIEWTCDRSRQPVGLVCNLRK